MAEDPRNAGGALWSHPAAGCDLEALRACVRPDSLAVRDGTPHRKRLSTVVRCRRAGPGVPHRCLFIKMFRSGRLSGARKASSRWPRCRTRRTTRGPRTRQGVIAVRFYNHILKCRHMEARAEAICVFSRVTARRHAR